MNIFWTEHRPSNIAKSYHDSHVNKIQTEIAQMASTSLRKRGVSHDSLYKKTHENHPMTEWVDRSFPNLKRALSVLRSLHEEWRFRYDHDNRMHKSYERMLDAVKDIEFKPLYDKSEFKATVPPRVGPDRPDRFADPENPNYTEIEIYYQWYYATHKCHDKNGKQMTWTKRRPPEWISFWRENCDLESLGDKTWSENKLDVLDRDGRNI